MHVWNAVTLAPSTYFIRQNFCKLLKSFNIKKRTESNLLRVCIFQDCHGISIPLSVGLACSFVQYFLVSYTCFWTCCSWLCLLRYVIIIKRFTWIHSTCLANWMNSSKRNPLNQPIWKESHHQLRKLWKLATMERSKLGACIILSDWQTSLVLETLYSTVFSGFSNKQSTFSRHFSCSK